MQSATHRSGVVGVTGTCAMFGIGHAAWLLTAAAAVGLGNVAAFAQHDNAQPTQPVPSASSPTTSASDSTPADGAKDLESVEQGVLLPGDVAPSLAGLRWIKGEERTALEPGIVHVVDAWATWCLPCERTVPHLSRVARAYGDRIRMVGVATWEQRFPLREGQTSYEARVRDYVRTREDRIAYDIAWDEGGVFERAWMRASRQVSIPTVFIVDRDGKIAWVGHPMMGMDEALAQVLAGSFDAALAFDAAQSLREMHAAGMKQATQLQVAVREERWEDAIAIAGKIYASNRVMFASSGVTKARLMLTRGDAREAVAFIESELLDVSGLEGFARSQRLEAIASFAEALLDSAQGAAQKAESPLAVRMDLASRLVTLGEAIVADATREVSDAAERDAKITNGEPLVVSVDAGDVLTLAGVRMRLEQFDAAGKLLDAAQTLDPDPSQQMQAEAMQRQIAARRSAEQAGRQEAGSLDSTPPAGNP